MINLLSSYLTVTNKLDVEPIVINDDEVDSPVNLKNETNEQQSNLINKEEPTLNNTQSGDETILSNTDNDDIKSPISNESKVDEKTNESQTLTTDEEEELKNDEEYEYIYVITRNKIPVAYIDDEKRLEDYISDFKVLILREYKQLYYMNYIWNDLVKFDIEQESLIHKFTLSSRNINTICNYYSIEEMIEIHRVEKIICKY